MGVLEIVFSGVILASLWAIVVYIYMSRRSYRKQFVSLSKVIEESSKDLLKQCKALHPKK